jgi:tetratricopeptide (TPR) repeat protein
VLDVALGSRHPTADDSISLVLRAVAELGLNRPDEALKDLANPVIGNQHDAAVWRALAYAKQGKWTEAREGFQNVGVGIAMLPIELQRRALIAAARASIEVRDFATAAKELSEFDTVGLTHEIEPTVAVLNGRLAEGLGHNDAALAAYRAAADSWDRPRAAQGRLRVLALRYGIGDLDRKAMINELEGLTTAWRGDDTEVEALQFLARLYTEERHYRDAFHIMRTALRAHPNSEMTRRIQEEAATTFDALFLAGQGDSMPPVEALSLFYDFRELTPIGRRGDEMIRRLADRLVSVDLLDQAAELLQHQVDRRLQGAARAQVATRLAVIYLMNRKPDRALATLRATRSADLATELRNQRILLEARALSDVGRHELALEVIASVEGREALRLRSDILWAAHKYREASEQIELLYGDRWRDFQPLADIERADVLRGAIGYALAEDALGLQRFRDKYAAKMAEGPDKRAFDVVSAPLGTVAPEFSSIAKTVAAVDTLDGFLREMRARYPDTGAVAPEARPAQAGPPAAAPAATPTPPRPANGSQAKAARADNIRTGSVTAQASAAPAALGE